MSKKENRKELRQDTLFDRHNRPWEHLGNLTVGLAQLASLPDNSVADVRAKENRYAELVHTSLAEAEAWMPADRQRRSSTEGSEYEGFEGQITSSARAGWP